MDRSLKGTLEAGDPQAQMAIYLARARAMLPELYAPSYQAISDQFAPQFTQARQFVGANPAVASSGVPNAINRRLLTGAYGALSNSLGQTNANVVRGGTDLLGDLIRRRQQFIYERHLAQMGQSGQNQAAAAGAVGAIGSAYAGR